MSCRPPRPATFTVAFPLAAALAVSSACTGSIDGGSAEPPGSAPTAPGTQGPGQPPPNPGGQGMPQPPLPAAGEHPLAPDRTSAACKEISPGPAPMRRLTRLEYDNTVRDLIGEDRKLARAFPKEELEHSFDNSAELRSVSDVLAEHYVNAAKEIGKSITGKLDRVLTCDPGKDGETTCLDRFLDGFGQRVWRRPLTSDERADLRKVFTNGRLATFADGIDAVVRVMVLAPQFMYRIETGVAGGSGPARLGHWEMASRLSYLLWGTMPDAELFAAAEAGKLGTRDEIGKQAERLLADPRATEMITNFTSQWLHLRELEDAGKETEIYPQWKDELLDLFRKETEGFIALAWKADGKVDTLLSAPYSAINGPLAAFYGMKGVTGDAFNKVELDPTQRAGVLTQASILAAKAGPDQSSPILRGVFVREQMFCQPLPQPPQNVEANPPMLDAKMTTKERFAAHRADPSCEGCHKLIDPIGFAFEKFDATGAYRTMENGKPVDATGELAGTDVDGKLDGALELGRKLVASAAVEACVSQHWFQFAFGRASAAGDRCTAETMATRFAKSGGDMRQLLLTLVQSDAFFFKGGLQ